MELVKFIDCKFQELRLAEADETKKNEYSVTREAETLALQSVLKAVRTVAKWVMIPKVLGNWLCVCLGIAEAPRPVLLEKMKADIEKKQAEDRKKLRKIGMEDLKTAEPEPTA